MTSILKTCEVHLGTAKAQYRMAMIVASFVLLANVLSFGAPQEPTSVAAEANATVAPATKTLNSPAGVAVDGAGRVYVANLGGGVTVYNKSLQLVGTLTTGLRNPVAVSVAPDGLIFVVNSASVNVDNLVKFHPNLTFADSNYDPSLKSPISMFVDGGGDVWVLDGFGTLHLYLESLAAIGTTSTVSASAIGPWGTSVYAWGSADGQARSQNIGIALHQPLTLDTSGPGPRAGAAAQDALGQEYLTILSTNQVQIWTSPNVGSGSVIINAVTTPSFPYGIAVDSINKRFYVSEPDANVVAVYSTVAPYKLIGTIH